jgi:RNA polymerase sigma-70 factor (ECF subfamily)
VALTAVDRNILHKLLQHESGAWNEFVDRFLGLVYHVIHYTAHLRSNPVTPEVVEDIAQEILVQLSANDYALLRQYRGNSSLSAYLTVVARRICVRELVKRTGPTRKALPPELQSTKSKAVVVVEEEVEELAPQERKGIQSLENVQRLIRKLPAREREVVRLFYLEGRTYEEISIELNLPVKTIGPILKRARKLLRQFESTTTIPVPPKQR